MLLISIDAQSTGLQVAEPIGLCRENQLLNFNKKWQEFIIIQHESVEAAFFRLGLD